MPRTQDSAKVLLNKFNPHIEALEDRSLPGNSLVGLTGIQDPFGLLNKHISKLSIATPPSAAASAKTKANSTFDLNSLIQLANKPITIQSSGVDRAASLIAKTTLATIEAGAASYAGNSGSTAAADGVAAAARALDSGVLQNNISRSQQQTNPTVTSNDNSDQLGSILGQFSGKVSYGVIDSNANSSSSSLGGSIGGNISTDNGDAGGYDLREVLANGQRRELSSSMLQAINSLKATTPGIQYTINNTLGTVNQLTNIKGFLTGTSNALPINIVKAFLSTNKGVFGITDADINSLNVTDNYKWAVGGATMLYVQQKINGIGVFDGVSTASVMPDGRLITFASNLVPNAQGIANSTTPAFDAKAAVAKAAADSASYLGITLNYGNLTTSSVQGGAEQGITYTNTKLSVDPIPVKLQYLAVQPGDLRLVWNLRIFIPNSTYLFEYNIDAQTGTVLTRNNWVQGDSYRVFASPTTNPDKGGRTLVTNPADATASPFGWHDINGKAGAEYTYLRGNNTWARESRKVPPGQPAGNSIFGQQGKNNYDFGLNLNNDPATYIPAATTNLFYWMNNIHDTLYNLGFTEPAGNFQVNNYGKGGLGNDPVLAFAQAGADLGSSDNAFFIPSVDGTPGRTAMFIANLPPSGTRDIDFENDTIGHEYFHGVSSRLVGGPNTLGLNTFSARGLGEGWSDFAGLFLTQNPAQGKNVARPLGGYSGGPIDTGNGIINTADPFGFRNYPYSYDMAVDPYTFADVDYTQAPHFKELGLSTGSFYQICDVWATVLRDMYWNLVDKYGYSSDLQHGNGGNNLAMKLVLAGCAMTTINPSILSARNAILAADFALTGGANQFEIWSAFARRGFGTSARDGVDGTATAANGQTYPCVVGVVESFDIPDGLVPVNPNPNPQPVPGGDGSKDALYEPNESSNTAFDLGSLTGLNTISDLMIKQNAAGKAADRDWFKFTPSKAGALTLNLDVATSAGDLDVRLYRSTNGSATNLTEIGIGQGTKRVVGGSETINVAVAAGTTYYLVVQGFNGGLGNYNLKITAPS